MLNSQSGKLSDPKLTREQLIALAKDGTIKANTSCMRNDETSQPARIFFGKLWPQITEHRKQIEEFERQEIQQKKQKSIEEREIRKALKDKERAEKIEIRRIKAENERLAQQQQIQPQQPLVHVANGQSPKSGHGISTISATIGIGFFVCIGICCSGIGSNGDSESAEEKELKPAWIQAMIEVRKRLKSPSTADFDVNYNVELPSRVKREGTDYIVTGAVDSKNAFNATVRTMFSVRLNPGLNMKQVLFKDVNSGEYRLVD